MRPTNYNPLRSWPANYWPLGGTAAVDTLTYAWPHDYWPGRYWAEYWPDYGTAAPPATIIPLVMHHLRQQGIS